MKDEVTNKKIECKQQHKGLDIVELIYAAYHHYTDVLSGDLNRGGNRIYKVDNDKYISYRYKASDVEKREIAEHIMGIVARSGDTYWKYRVRIVSFRDISKGNEHMLIRALEEDPLVENSLWERWCIVNAKLVLNPEQSEKLIKKMIIQRDVSLRIEDEYLESLLPVAS